jgi:hypothetical protein
MAVSLVTNIKQGWLVWQCLRAGHDIQDMPYRLPPCDHLRNSPRSQKPRWQRKEKAKH